MKGEIMNTPKRIIIAGGGTGGHLFPGIAVAAELRERLGAEILFVGTRRGIEARVLPKRGEQVEFLEVTPLKGRSAGDLLRSVGRLPSATLEARRVVRRFGADLVIGVGGYASGPVLAAAASLGVPTAVLEQNAHLGLTNRLVAPIVGRGYLTFDETTSPFGARARVLGNPIRPAIQRVARLATSDPDGFASRANTLLVLGGSQGAQALNEGVPAELGALGESLRGVRIVHQCGVGNADDVRARYEAEGLEVEVVEFIDDMASAYTSALMVVGRAGATTLAELCAVGCPSVLVPFPHAADDHQTRNARSLEDVGAARWVPQSELLGNLGDTIGELLDPSVRLKMSAAARRRGRPEAAAAIVDDVCEWLHWNGPAGTGPSVEDVPHDQAELLGETGPIVEAAERGRLRGFGSYQPTLIRRRSSPPEAPRRALVFQNAHGWK